VYRPRVDDLFVVVIEATKTGVIVDVRVIPRAGKRGIAGVRDNAVLIRLLAPPVEGAANAELVEVIAEALGVAKRAVAIVSGDTSRRKRVRINGVTLAHAVSRLPH
jgi:uncharacterized protein (TIGR00251 family)